MKTRSGRLGLVVLVAASALGACGGDSAISKSDFIAQADRLCAAANQKLDSLPEPQTIEQFRAVLGTGVNTTKKLVSDLRALGTPSEGRETLQSMYAQVEQGVAKFEQASTALTSGDPARADTLAQEGQGLLDQASKTAESYGFSDCAE